MTSQLDQNLEEVLQRLARSRHDEDAWNLLYKQIWPFVYSLTYRALRGQRELAADASQDVLIRVLRYADFQVLQTPKDFRAYVRTVCQNVANDFWAHTRRDFEAPVARDESDSIEEPPSDTPTPEQILLAKELFAELLNQLDDEDQGLLLLLTEGRSLAEIAQHAGISYSNAAVRVHRIRLFLAKYLKEKGLS